MSVILFGSAASGAFSQSSDVDLILVLPDQASAADRSLVRHEVNRLELLHGLRPPQRNQGPIERLAERAAGYAHACFVCSRADFMSAEVGRVFGLRKLEAVFLERMFFASVMVSAKTVCGEDLLSPTALPALRPLLLRRLVLRRLDVLKSLFRSTAFLLFCTAAYPILSGATRYTMSTLKHALHSCYFCYHLQIAPVTDEAAFFLARLGHNRALRQYLDQRQHYRPSFAFVLRCLPLLLRLHLQSLRDNRFPQVVVREQ